MKHVTIPQALERVANNPGEVTDIESPMHAHIAHTLFEIANRPDRRVRGAMTRATKAQRIIFDRLVGKRRAGTHPAQVKDDEIEFLDLTVPGEIEKD